MAFYSPQPTSENIQDDAGVRLCAHVAPLNDTGQKRKNNEDSHLIFPLDDSVAPQNGEENVLGLSPPGLLLAVADGMGGHIAGEVASRMCVENLAKEMTAQFLVAGATAPDLSVALRKAVEAAHQGVYTHSQQHAQGSTMGTTLTAAVLNGSRATVAQVGDSRAYLFRGGSLILLTQDQTIGNLLRSRGEDSDRVSSQIKEMLTQAVGAQPDIEVIMSAVDLEPGDVLLLCSDGLYKAVSASGMVEPEDLAMGVIWPLQGEPAAKPKPGLKPKPRSMRMAPKGLWSEPLLTGTVQPNAYPAKWGPSFTYADCFHDYVVYPTGTAGTSGAASIFAFYTLYTNCPSQVIPSIYWAFNTGGTVSTSPIISLDGSQVAFIQQVSGDSTTASLVLLKPFLTVQGNISDNSETLTVTSGTVTSADVGMLILGQGIGPGTTVTDVSGDGSTITMSEGAANDMTGVTLALAEPGTLSSPWSLTSQASGAAYQACAAPCMLTLPFSGAVNDTLSAPFYDYTNDALYVGDDSGNLHMFTEVFNGTPSEVTTSSWPVSLGGKGLASPVYDPVSGNVFVGDVAGYLYSVSSAGSVAKSANLGDVIIDGPLVDSSAGTVYAFVTTNNDASGQPAIPGYNAVFQFATNFSSGSNGNGTATGTELGAGGAGYYLQSGTFDNVYYLTSGSAGNLWVAGNTGATAGPGKLYRIPISISGMGTPGVAVASLTGSSLPSWSSPLVEFCNNGKNPCSTDGTNTIGGGIDYLFFSVNSGDLTVTNKCTNGAGNGCVLAYDITTPSSPALSGSLNVTNVGSNGCWATGGLVIDNSDDYQPANQNQVYFIGLNGNTAGGPGGPTSKACTSVSGKTTLAWQASQSDLQ
ncbi:MAG: protein phosphatase 2C domain-containing protein [Terriglobia bacterium]